MRSCGAKKADKMEGEPVVKHGEDEPVITLDGNENPQNWSWYKKAYYVLSVGLASFSVTAGTSLITPGIPEIETHFHVSETAATLSLSLFVLGLAMGPIIAAPISETLGRAAIYRILPPIYMLFLLGAGFCDRSFGGLLVLRFLAGAAGSPPLAVGAGTIADLYAPSKRAAPLCLFICTPFLGSGFGPVIGGFAAYYKGYRWTQWVSIFIAIATYIFSLPMRETYQKALLRKKAKKLGRETAAQQAPLGKLMVQVLTITVARPVKMLFLEPIVLLLTLYNAFTFSVLFAFFAAYPYVFGKVYSFNTWQVGLVFLGIAVGVMLAGITGVVVDRYMYQPRHARALRKGRPGLPPEYMLFTSMIGTAGVPISLFWFAWTARSSVHWISPTLAGVMFAWGSVAVFLSAAMYLIQSYGPINGASAMAANGLGRYLMSAGFPLFTVQMYRTLDIAWATSLLAFISAVLLPIPFVFYVYGPWFRQKVGSVSEPQCVWKNRAHRQRIFQHET